MSADEYWIVDYDIPSEPASKRQQFYRKLTRILEKMNVEKDWSTQSVVIVKDEEVAKAVHALARAYGMSHLY